MPDKKTSRLWLNFTKWSHRCSSKWGRSISMHAMMQHWYRLFLYSSNSIGWSMWLPVNFSLPAPTFIIHHSLCHNSPNLICTPVCLAVRNRIHQLGATGDPRFPNLHCSDFLYNGLKFYFTENQVMKRILFWIRLQSGTRRGSLQNTNLTCSWTALRRSPPLTVRVKQYVCDHSTWKLIETTKKWEKYDPWRELIHDAENSNHFVQRITKQLSIWKRRLCIKESNHWSKLEAHTLIWCDFSFLSPIIFRQQQRAFNTTTWTLETMLEKKIYHQLSLTAKRARASSSNISLCDTWSSAAGMFFRWEGTLKKYVQSNVVAKTLTPPKRFGWFISLKVNFFFAFKHVNLRELLLIALKQS